MRIIVLFRLNPFFESSASSNRWRTLLEGLSHLNANITIFITGGYNSIDEYRKLNIRGNLGRIHYRYFNFLFYSNIWLNRINHYILFPITIIWVKTRIKRIIKRKPESIVWVSHDLVHLKMAVTLKKEQPSLKLFIEMSEFLDIHHIHKGNILRVLEGNNLQKFFERTALHYMDGMALMTKTLFKHYQDFPDPKPHLIHLPMTVDLNRFNLNKKYFVLDDLQTPYIAYIGVMANQKDGVDILIDSFAQTANLFPDLTLYLFGFYHYDTPGHLKRINDLGLEERVYYKGMVLRDEIPDIIMNARLLVLPRPDSKQAQGGFPTKLGEYLATGNPVCVTKVGEIHLYLEDEVSAFMAKPGSVDSFADAMQRALSNPGLAKKVGENGRTIAEKHFNMDSQAKILYDFLYFL